MHLPFNKFWERDRTEFPGVVVSLSTSPAQPQPDPTNEKNGHPEDKSIDKASTDSEKGIRAVPLPDSGPMTLESLRAQILSELDADSKNTPYDIKSKVINRAIQDIGMGRYQWELFVLCGFGWLADNLWLQGVALTLTQVAIEFGVSQTRVRFTTCALFLGLCLGASFWGIVSDVVGRRLAFNTTLFLAGVFGIAAGAGPTWVGVSGLFACLGLGVGGNLPVDGALFLEYLPFASANMLTMLSVWWPVGQLISSLLAWAYIPNFSCSADLPSCHKVADGVACCRKEDNMGWRYFTYTLGALTFLMWMCRFFIFHLYESPKFLLARGRQEEAVATVQGIAYTNKTQTWLTVEVLDEIGGYPEEGTSQSLSIKEIIERNLSKFSFQRIAPLFETKRLAITTILLWICWSTIGMGYPLFNAFLPQYISESASTNITYRNYAITSAVGVPGSILACWTVEIKYVGRKGTMAIATVITGVLLFCFTVNTDPNVQLVCSSLEAFFQNIMYGVLYAYTPEVFPAPVRGTGTGVSSFFNRLCGLCAPLVAIYGGDSDPKAPIYASAY
ncbi:hypothetical protein MPDQ_004366 [Monascus purpureus]|uniref:Major facilitator superfamily (MFS) profile domain-containing protein n=1 Tax=Monascus purpureus TaxID=5098 RepID=A0A507QXV6_MONPU|nr:hypothetical protein MPDQ_004366 [Monascus purpureus]